MALIGKYVDTFAEATHALPDGMHMNADYPFMLPPIVSKDGKTVTIKGRDGKTATAKIMRVVGGSREFFVLAQSSTFERLFHRKPTPFTFYPFAAEAS